MTGGKIVKTVLALMIADIKRVPQVLETLKKIYQKVEL
jgi:hypothetical protein